MTGYTLGNVSIMAGKLFICLENIFSPPSKAPQDHCPYPGDQTKNFFGKWPKIVSIWPLRGVTLKSKFFKGRGKHLRHLYT